MPGFSDTIQTTPITVDLVLLDYAHKKHNVALYEAQAALLKYPRMADAILPVYGESPKFRKILGDYGSSVLPPIYYFMKNDIKTVDAMYYSAQEMQKVRGALGKLKTKLGGVMALGANDSGEPTRSKDQHGAQGSAAATAMGLRSRELSASRGHAGGHTGESSNLAPLTPKLRGQFAVSFIHRDGHDFLSQFAVAENGQVTWIQTKRMLEDLSSGFTAPVIRLDTKLQTGVHVTPGDIGWVAADIIGAADGGSELMSGGRAVVEGLKGAEIAEDASRVAGAAEVRDGLAYEADDAAGGKGFGTGGEVDKGVESGKVFRQTRTLLRYAPQVTKYGAIGVVVASVLIFVTHPLIFFSWMIAVFSNLAHEVGVSELPVELIGCFVVMLPVLYVCSLICRFLVRPAIFTLGVTIKGLQQIHRVSTS